MTQTASTKKKWRFRVSSLTQPGIRPLECEAWDEGEAVRLFCMQRRDMKGRELNGLSHQHKFNVKCLDPERDKQIMQKYLDKGKAPPIS